MWTLEKMSLPNVWSKKFATKIEAMDELRNHICGRCMDEINGFDHELLGTPCGLEFDVYEAEDKA